MAMTNAEKQKAKRLRAKAKPKLLIPSQRIPASEPSDLDLDRFSPNYGIDKNMTPIVPVASVWDRLEGGLPSRRDR